MIDALLAIISIFLMVVLLADGRVAYHNNSEWWALYFVGAFMALVGWVVFLARAVSGL